MILILFELNYDPSEHYIQIISDHKKVHHPYKMEKSSWKITEIKIILKVWQFTIFDY